MKKILLVFIVFITFTTRSQEKEDCNTVLSKDIIKTTSSYDEFFYELLNINQTNYKEYKKDVGLNTNVENGDFFLNLIYNNNENHTTKDTYFQLNEKLIHNKSFLTYEGRTTSTSAINAWLDCMRFKYSNIQRNGYIELTENNNIFFNIRYGYEGQGNINKVKFNIKFEGCKVRNNKGNLVDNLTIKFKKTLLERINHQIEVYKNPYIKCFKDNPFNESTVIMSYEIGEKIYNVDPIRIAPLSTSSVVKIDVFKKRSFFSEFDPSPIFHYSRSKKEITNNKDYEIICNLTGELNHGLPSCNSGYDYKIFFKIKINDNEYIIEGIKHDANSIVNTKFNDKSLIISLPKKILEKAYLDSENNILIQILIDRFEKKCSTNADFFLEPGTWFVLYEYPQTKQ